MWLLDKLDKILPGIQTTASLTKGIRQTYVDEYMKRDDTFAVTFPGPASLQKLVTAMDKNIISPEQAHRELGIGDIYMEWATRSEHQWRKRTQARGKCLWCTTPYEDESGSCTKCGAPKDVGAVALAMTTTTLGG